MSDRVVLGGVEELDEALGDVVSLLEELGSDLEDDDFGGLDKVKRGVDGLEGEVREAGHVEALRLLEGLGGEVAGLLNKAEVERRRREDIWRDHSRRCRDLARDARGLAVKYRGVGLKSRTGSSSRVAGKWADVRAMQRAVDEMAAQCMAWAVSEQEALKSGGARFNYGQYYWSAKDALDACSDVLERIGRLV